MSKKKSLQFEPAMKELDKLVATLENGDLPLDEALKHFEQGISLVRDCQKKLTEAEQHVAKLTKTAETETLEPFDDDA